MQTTADGKDGYYMAKSVSIKGFRGFKNVSVEDCRRVNVIVGENGSGKTAFLEAIFLAAGASVELAMRTKQWRGFESVTAGGSQKQLDEALWGDLFHNFQGEAEASVRLAGTAAHERFLKMELIPSEQVSIPVPKAKGKAKIDTTVKESGISFTWTGPYRAKQYSVASFKDGKLTYQNPPEAPILAAFFAANQTASSQETVIRYSDISKRFRTRPVLKAFRELFPSVSDLSIELVLATPMVFATVEGHETKMPIQLLSGGMTKLASIMIAIPTVKEGVLLIDEIENGFYYKKLPLVWENLASLADEYDVQLFVSTHSYECLSAAATAARKRPELFSLVRTVQGKGECETRQFAGEDFVNAIDAEQEVR